MDFLYNLLSATTPAIWVVSKNIWGNSRETADHMENNGISPPKKRSPGRLESGYLLLPVSFETEMRFFSQSVLKTFLAIRFRTIFQDHVPLSTAALARITGLSEESVRKALRWLAYPDSRSGDEDSVDRRLPTYIRLADEEEHEHSGRLVQTIYVEGWKDPRVQAKELSKPRKPVSNIEPSF